MRKQTGVCAVDSCPALRAKGSYLCAAHDADVRNNRPVDGAKAVTKPARPRQKKLGGITFAQQCQFAGLPVPVAEFRFHPVRKWRFDWAWVDQKLAMEVHGGAFMQGGGAHTRGAGFRDDAEKMAEAAIAGWRIIPVLPEQIDNGIAINLIERAIAAFGSGSISECDSGPTPSHP